LIRFLFFNQNVFDKVEINFFSSQSALAAAEALNGKVLPDPAKAALIAKAKAAARADGQAAPADEAQEEVTLATTSFKRNLSPLSKMLLSKTPLPFSSLNLLMFSDADEDSLCVPCREEGRAPAPTPRSL